MSNESISDEPTPGLAWAKAIINMINLDAESGNLSIAAKIILAELEKYEKTNPK